jgi:hypothetical protein
MSQPWPWARFGCPGPPKGCLHIKTHQRLLETRLRALAAAQPSRHRLPMPSHCHCASHGFVFFRVSVVLPSLGAQDSPVAAPRVLWAWWRFAPLISRFRHRMRREPEEWSQAYAVPTLIRGYRREREGPASANCARSPPRRDSPRAP